MLSEAIEKIKTLMKQEKWLEAHRACLEILRFDPENLKVIRLKSRIEKIVKKLNVKALKDDLQSIQPLWQEKKFDELMAHLKELEPYKNEYPPLKKFIKKVQGAYRETMREQQEKFYEGELKRIEQLRREHQYQEAVRSAQKLRILKLHENEVKKVLRQIKNEWVEYELEQNKTLLESEKYEDALLKLQQIKKIDPKSLKIQGLLKNIKAKYQSHRVMEKRDFIYKGIEKTRTLMQLKKFDKAVQAVQEILDIDPNNTKAQSLFMKAKRKFARSMENELSVQMKKARKEMKEQFQKNKEKYIKL